MVRLGTRVRPHIVPARSLNRSFNAILDGVGDIDQQENDGIVTENDENGSESVSPDVMKVSDSGCEQHYIYSTTPGAQNIPKSTIHPCYHV